MISWFEHKYPYTNFHELNLDWMLKHFTEFITEINTLEEWKTQHEAEYQQLKDLYDSLMLGNYPATFENSLTEWIQNNIFDIVGELVHNVFFGLTNSGYFVAYIPESWNDIIFNTTGLDINTDLMPEYGHLVLSY